MLLEVFIPKPLKTWSYNYIIEINEVMIHACKAFLYLQTKYENQYAWVWNAQIVPLFSGYA